MQHVLTRTLGAGDRGVCAKLLQRMSSPRRNFHTIPSSRCWDGAHELPGLAPPAAGAPAFCVTLFLSFPLDPRNCPVAGHLDGAASLFLALPLIFCVFWLNHPVWQGFPEPAACARVPVSFSPGCVPASVPALPSWPCPALLCPQLCISHWGLEPVFPSPAPKGAVSWAGQPTQRSEQSLSRCGMQRGKRHREAGAGLAPIPDPGANRSHRPQLRDWGRG